MNVRLQNPTKMLTSKLAIDDHDANPETLFKDPAEAQRVLNELRQKYNNKSKTEVKAAPVHQHPHVPLSAKPADSGNEAKTRPLLVAIKDTNDKNAASAARVCESYLMTDTEDSEYDTDDSEGNAERRAKKQVPSWARSKRLVPTLAAQDDPSFPIDPDHLFGKVTTCDLEAVFNRKSSRYRQARTSGVWATSSSKNHNHK
jgi:Inner centromere protein, ARK binding region